LKNVLLDTNIILDIALNRSPFVEDSAKVLYILEKLSIPAYVSATTITDIYYIASKSLGNQLAKEFLKDMFDFLDILGVDKLNIINALDSELADFEDAVQIDVALMHQIECIITRNTKDFINSPILILSPQEFVSRF